MSTSTTRAFSVYCRAKLNDAVNRVVKTHNALDYGDIGIFYISEKPNNMLSVDATSRFLLVCMPRPGDKKSLYNQGPLFRKLTTPLRPSLCNVTRLAIIDTFYKKRIDVVGKNRKNYSVSGTSAMNLLYSA